MEKRMKKKNWFVSLAAILFMAFMLAGCATSKQLTAVQDQAQRAMEKADLAFKTLMQIRNKLVDAYKQVEQMRL